MVQTSASMKREERLLQARQDFKKCRTDKLSGCRAKTSKTNEQNEAWKTPLLNRNFRYSERFIREDSEQPSLRREKTFDNTLLSNERESESSKAIHENRMKSIEQQLKDNRLSPLAASSKPLRKSLPSLLVKDNEEKDEFRAELKKATSRIRNDISKINVSENKTSQNDKTSAHKPNPTKTTQSKVKESSLKPNNVNKQDTKAVSRISRPLGRVNETKTASNNVAKSNAAVNKYKFNSKDSGKSMPDRGQASGKESTPEHSPTRRKEQLMNKINHRDDK